MSGLVFKSQSEIPIPLSHANYHLQSILPAKCILQSCLSQNIEIAGVFHLFKYYHSTFNTSQARRIILFQS